MYNSLTSRDIYRQRQLPQGDCGVAWSFLALLAAFIVFVVITTVTNISGFLAVTIICGWLISLALHEYGHARVAYQGGDDSVIDKGYLRFDLLTYVDPIMTLLIPTLILIFGGIALPGGSVIVSTSSIGSKRWQTLTSLAGPFANFLFGAVLAAILQMYFLITSGIGYSFAPAISLLIYFQLMAMVLNMLPLPPLDGWGAVSPWLPENFCVKRWMKNPWHAKSISLITFLIIFVGFQYIPGISWLFSALTKVFWLDEAHLTQGHMMFRRATSLRGMA